MLSCSSGGKLKTAYKPNSKWFLTRPKKMFYEKQ